MTVDETTGMDAAKAAGVEVRAAARELIRGLVRRPWGNVSPSVYETGRLVALAPWLAGHRRRIDFLLAEQHADGTWGGPGGYALVPTLSAVDALLEAAGAGAAPLPAAERGLRALARVLPAIDPSAVPDMPAIDLIAGSLVASINRRLDGRGGAVPALRPPAGVDGERLAMVRAAVRDGTGLPLKVLHALEVVGTAARGHAEIVPESTGTVGASAAATAAWLDVRSPLAAHSRARHFLERVVEDHHGLAPCGIPITVFERSWVVAGLARAGVEFTVPASFVDGFTGALGPDGVAAAAGLPADADTTAVLLYALDRLGVPRPPDALWGFETATHFCTWQGEQGFSVTTNAHVLDAFGRHLRAAGTRAAGGRYAAAAAGITALLGERQRADGSWLDRWHASPYYATLCCALALHDFGGAAAAGAVARAREWILETQRADGSWGLWDGTAEETAYGLQTLALTGAAPPQVQESINRGYEFLLHVGVDGIAGPALWHDKDLYRPEAIVRAAVLGALHLADTVRTPGRGRRAGQ